MCGQQCGCGRARRDINFHFKWNVQRSSQIANNKFLFSLEIAQIYSRINSLKRCCGEDEIKQKSIKARLLIFWGLTID